MILTGMIFATVAFAQSPEGVDATGSNPTADVDAALIQLSHQMAALVAKQRELTLLEPIEVRIEDAATLRARTLSDFEEEDTQRELRELTETYTLLRILPPDIDLGATYLDVLTDHVAGYYDPEHRHLALIRRAAAFHEASIGALSEDAMTIAHEVVHALQDQHFDLWALAQRTHSNDVAAALQALIEGDATLSMLHFGRGADLPASAVHQYVDEGYDLRRVPAGTPLARLPRILQAGLIFPYAEGTHFAAALFAAGGLQALDAAYADPPLSTEQILHPERYLGAHRDPPLDVEMPDLSHALGPGWRASFDDVVGELGTRLLLEEHLGAEHPGLRAAAEGWGGDRLAVYRQGSDDDEDAPVAGVWATTWDSPRDAATFARVADAWLRAIFHDYPTRRQQLVRDDRCATALRSSRTEVLILLDTPCEATSSLRRALRGLPWAPILSLDAAGEPKPRPDTPSP